MGNAYSEIFTFDEKKDQVSKIDKQINSLKKHLEFNIKNEEKIKNIRFNEILKEINQFDEEQQKKIDLKKKFINTLKRNSRTNEELHHNLKLTEINNNFDNRIYDVEAKHKKSIVLMELKKNINIKKIESERNNTIMNLKNNFVNYQQKIYKNEINDIKKLERRMSKKILLNNERNNQLKDNIVIETNNRVGQITDNIKEKIIFLLKNKSKLIDQIKKMKIEENV